MQPTPLVNELPLGLVELDATGTVLYFNQDNNDHSVSQTSEMIGRNFFTDVWPVAQHEEFCEIIAEFRRGHAPSESFNFIFDGDAGRLPVRVLLARIHEQMEGGAKDSVLVHIRKA